VLLVLLLLNIVNFYDRHVPGALAEPMRREFHLSDAQIGWISTIFTLLYAVIGLPLGRLADGASRKKLLAAGCALWGMLTGAAAWAFSYPTLLLTRLGVAVGEATCAPAATSWIGDAFPAARRARALAVFMLGVPIGGALSFFFSGPVAQAWGWRAAMVLAAAPALMLAPLLLLLREPLRGASERTAHTARASVREVLRVPAFWWIVLSGILVNFNLYAIGTFLPAFFGRIHHLNVGRAGILTGIVYLIGGLSGAAIGGMRGDSMAGCNAAARLRTAAIGALVAAPLAWFGVRQGWGMLALALPLLTGAYGALNMYYGLVYACMQDIVGPALRGSAMAIYFLVMYLGGASFGPLLTGKLSDALAHRAAGAAAINETFKAIGLQQAMLIIPALSLLLALVLWRGSRSLAKNSTPAPQP
jgi:MFS family permease